MECHEEWLCPSDLVEHCTLLSHQPSTLFLEQEVSKEEVAVAEGKGAELVPLGHGDRMGAGV